MNLVYKKITSEIEDNAVKIFTMGCGVDCAIFSVGKKIEDLGLEDPHGEERVRIIFEKLQILIDTLLLELQNNSPN